MYRSQTPYRSYKSYSDHLKTGFTVSQCGDCCQPIGSLLCMIMKPNPRRSGREPDPTTMLTAFLIFSVTEATDVVAPICNGHLNRNWPACIERIRTTCSRESKEETGFDYEFGWQSAEGMIDEMSFFQTRHHQAQHGNTIELFHAFMALNWVTPQMRPIGKTDRNSIAKSFPLRVPFRMPFPETSARSREISDREITKCV